MTTLAILAAWAHNASEGHANAMQCTALDPLAAGSLELQPFLAMECRVATYHAA